MRDVCEVARRRAIESVSGQCDKRGRDDVAVVQRTRSESFLLILRYRITGLYDVYSNRKREDTSENNHFHN